MTTAGKTLALIVAASDDEVWYATTDADSRVDPDWLIRQIGSGADVVLGARRVDLGAQDDQVHGVAREVVVAGRAARLEGDVEPAMVGDEVPHAGGRERGRVVVEGKAAGLALGPDAGMQVGERFGESLQVRRVGVGHHVDVGGHVGRAVDHTGETADQLVAHGVTSEHLEQLLGPELSLGHR